MIYIKMWYHIYTLRRGSRGCNRFNPNYKIIDKLSYLSSKSIFIKKRICHIWAIEFRLSQGHRTHHRLAYRTPVHSLAVIEMSSTDTQCLALPMGATCYWKDMWQQLNSMRSQFQLCDVILSTIDDGMYGAHSPVLAASSNVFYEYFLSKSNCSSVITQLDSSKNIKLLINGINRQVLHVSIYKNMLKYGHIFLIWL